MTDQFIAHVKQSENGEWVIHSLEEHLREVGRIAGEFAKDFESAEWARLAGLWHDLGKYRPVFQSYIRRASGFDTDAHIEGSGKVDHSTAGAIHAVDKFKSVGRVLAYLIAGHHAGLPDWNSADAGNSALSIRIEEGINKNYLNESLAGVGQSEILNVSLPASKPLGDSAGLHLWMRMLFSCLVDADFLDTEAFMSPEKAVLRFGRKKIIKLKAVFDAHMEEKSAKAEATPVNKIRARILNDCRTAAQNDQGIFTLTVPTGGGKTLSAMAFALDHAVKHGLKRVIVAIPYTSIIEQTADQYREIFADGVLEHHSNLDIDKETAKSRLAAENWDASIVVTTNVQLLESLFAAKTSRCRKLHNIANSVIVIDEAQLLPPDFLQPVLDVLRLLTDCYGVTLVLSTATQPALASRIDSHGRTILRGVDNAKEIISDVSSLYTSLDRVYVRKPRDMNCRVDWKALADELLQHDSVLSIVNTRKDCRQLFDLMPEGTIHLSASMCGQHRSDVIAEIKRKLKEKEPVKVISTQLVEAGVDLDFPVVYRALAGLDSIAQAAGRCNREGKRDKGEVIVFVPPNPAPKGMLLFGEQATRSVWHGYEGHPLSHELFEKYFQQYFGSEQPDKHGINELLTKDAQQCVLQFRSAADKFRLIDDKNTWQVLVPYKEKGETLLRRLASGEMHRGILRELQRYSVSVYEQEFKKLREIGAIEELQPDLWAVCVTNAYDKSRGLLLADDFYSKDAEGMVI